MTRIGRQFARLKKEKRKALVVFITAGDPSLKKTEALVVAFEKEGADLIELGVPFSDPLADGPVIQAASLRALRKKTTVSKILRSVRNIRKKSQVPILLMTYLNPVLNFGVSRFAAQAHAAGVDGIIVPDLPPEEGRAIAAALKKAGMDLVYLLAPTSTPRRCRLIARASSGFVYYVSLTGVTGSAGAHSRAKGTTPIEKHLRMARRASRLPVLVGFGISTPAQARQMAAMSDGVIVGSAVVKKLAQHASMTPAIFAKKFVHPFASALRG